jgi:hypothetical protein
VTGVTYEALRRSLGDRKTVAKLMGCAPVTIRFREEGRLRITEEAAARLVDAVHALALEEDARRVRRRARRLGSRENRVMTPLQFRTPLQVLGWTHRQAAAELTADARDVRLISGWATGRTRVPDWVARDLRTALGLSPGDPWPSGYTRHELVLPEW